MLDSGIGKFTVTALLVVWVGFRLPSTFAQEPEARLYVTKGSLKTLGSLAVRLSRYKREDESEALRRIGVAMGHTELEATRLAKRCKSAAMKAVAGREDKIGAVRDALAKLARRLGRELAGQDLEMRSKLARLILAIDDSVEDAHVVLQHEKEGERWVTPEIRAAAARRATLDARRELAKTLDVGLRESTSAERLLVHATGTTGHRVDSESCEVHSDHPAAATRAVLESALRALAFSEYHLRGQLRLPRAQPTTWLFLAERPSFDKALERVIEKKILLGDPTAAKSAGAFRDKRGRRVVHAPDIDAQTVGLFRFFRQQDVRFAKSQACLRAGHMNVICLEILGRPLVATGPRKARPGGEPTPVGYGACHEEILALARRREDPAWSSAMVEDLASISGVELLKTTAVVRYLHERDLLAKLLAETAPDAPLNSGRPAEAVFDRRLPGGLAGFEDEWQNWLLPRASDLISKLSPPGEGDSK